MVLPDTLLQQFPVAWVALSNDCTVTDHNSKFSALVRARDARLVGRKLTEIWHPSCHVEFLNGVAEMHAVVGLTVTIHVTLTTSGRPIDLRLSGEALAEGTDIGTVLLTAEPVVQSGPGSVITPYEINTEQNDISEMLVRRGETLAGSWILAANEAAEDLLGYSKDILMEGGFEKALDLDLTNHTLIDAETSFHAGQPFQTTYLEKKGDKLFRMVDWKLTPLDLHSRFWLDRRQVRGRDGHVFRGEDQSGLLLGDPNMHAVGDIGIWSWDLLTNESSYSPRLLASMGHDLEGVDDLVMFRTNTIHPDDLKMAEKAVRTAIEDRKPFAYVLRMRGADGQYRSIHMQGQPILDNNGLPVQLVGTEVEITEQIELKDKLLRAEQIAQVGNWSRRLGNPDMYWSPELYRINRVSPETYNPSLDTVNVRVHPDDQDLVAHGEQRILKKWQQNPDMVDRVRVRMVHPDQTIRHCEISATVVVDADGKPFELVGTVQDITELVEAQQRLLDAQKVEVVGQLAGGAAHDFNNLLAVIMGSLELLQDEGGIKERTKYIQTALSATHRGAELTRNLLSFARKAVLNPRRLDLNDIMDDIQNLIRQILPGTIQLEVHSSVDLWPVHADKSSFENAVLNLAINSRDAMPDGGLITIVIENKILSDTYTEEHQETLDPGRYVVFSVTDTGAGIPEDLMREVFTPYFTTKPMDKGSGLGLSMVHGFARQSGGGLRLYSKVGIGTTVKLFFQASELDIAAENNEKIAALSGVLPGRVLLVEDSEQVRQFMEHRLKELGLHCTLAKNADDAVKIYAQGDGFDLLVTDTVMPGALQGPDLARQLRKLQPDLKVIFTTGYGNEALIRGNGVRAGDLRLMKPVSKLDLKKAVYAALEL